MNGKRIFSVIAKLAMMEKEFGGKLTKCVSLRIKKNQGNTVESVAIGLKGRLVMGLRISNSEFVVIKEHEEKLRVYTTSVEFMPLVGEQFFAAVILQIDRSIKIYNEKVILYVKNMDKVIRSLSSHGFMVDKYDKSDKDKCSRVRDGFRFIHDKKTDIVVVQPVRQDIKFTVDHILYISSFTNPPVAQIAPGSDTWYAGKATIKIQNGKIVALSGKIDNHHIFSLRNIVDGFDLSSVDKFKDQLLSNIREQPPQKWLLKTKYEKN